MSSIPASITNCSTKFPKEQNNSIKTKKKNMKQVSIITLLFKILILHTLMHQHETSADYYSLTTKSNATDQLALLAFKSQIKWDSNAATIFDTWKTNTSICNWFGITCSLHHQRVRVLNLSYAGLEGTITPYIGNLSFLRILKLCNNSFHGPLPQTLGHLRRLEFIDLRFNHLQGVIPSNISQCKKLQMIYLGFNQIQGNIPKEITSLPNLKVLSLPYNSLLGIFPLNIFNMSTLMFIFLTQNSFSRGSLPMDMCHKLPNLEILGLSSISNPTSTQIPSSICMCKNLRHVQLRNFGLKGTIPKDIDCLLKLEYLVLIDNQLTGTIPASLGNLSFLQVLEIGNNKMFGEIPQELGRISTLRVLDLGYNSFSGTLPSSILNLSSLEWFQIPYNNLTGRVMELKLPKVSILHLANNQFYGTISNLIPNASMLTVLDLSGNFFTGSVPATLGSLRFLEKLLIGGNQFSNEFEFLTSLSQCEHLDLLSVSGNPLKGELPKSIGNLSNSFEIFDAEQCQIRGSLPYEIGNLSRLAHISLANNDIVGRIPHSVSNLRSLQRLDLFKNQIEGDFPYSLCLATSISELYFDENKLSGPIPSCINNFTQLRVLSFSCNAFTSVPQSLWSLTKIWSLNLSCNFLTGHLHPEFGSLVHLITLDMSKNKLSGSIPNTSSNLKMLEFLNLSNNAFQGTIPIQIGNLGSLKSLDLSFNNLSGVIPMSLEKLPYIKHLNLSFNNLSGEVPANGALTNYFTFMSFIGNAYLCGSSRLKLPPCKVTRTDHVPKIKKVTFWLTYVLPPIGVLVGLTSMLVLLYMIICKRNNKKLSTSSIELLAQQKFISYHELVRATNNFSEENMLGRGSFGSVYKGTIMSNGVDEVIDVAVKVFNLLVDGAFVSFDRECQVLGNVRHRNLLKIISSCSNMEFRALIFEYMPNGSLHKLLYDAQESQKLSILQLIDILIDVAMGLEYLHYGYSEPIVHCDLKPHNILLDQDMVAHVGDFGIAKILARDKSMTQTELIGTMGYIAPEFGGEGMVSTKGDVYSYGIILMEAFTRKSPMDETFAEGWSLRQWVSSNFPNQVMEIVDTSQVGMTSVAMEFLTCIIELALLCSNHLPHERPTMNEVVTKFKKIRTRYLIATTSRRR